MRRLLRLRRSWLAAGVVGCLTLVIPAAGAAGTLSPRGLVSAAATTAGPRLTASMNAGCNGPQKKGFARCFSVVRTPSTRQITAENSPPSSALGPSDIQSAYHLPSSGGGQTVAIVDAFGDSNAESDLAVFRSFYGLPPCTTANGCFRKVDQAGGTSYPPDDAGWALETSLDLDAVSSACPNCNILLVEGNDNNTDNLGAAVDEAVSLGARYVSNSYGVSGEFDNEQSSDVHYNHPGVAVTASSGDTGDITNWPATDPNVVAVGGTRLTSDPSVPRGWDETAWSSAGSGCSPFEPQPDYQNGISTGCASRAIADISADADPASGLATFDTDGQGGWLQVGGTSLSSPLIAAMYALAGTPVAGTYPVTYPYHDPSPASDLFDITQGSNGSCGNVLCTAGPGWDGPTGLGTPDGVQALAGAPQGVISGQVTSAATGAPVAGATVTASPGGYATSTDAAGDYTLNVAVGSYDVTAAAYAYRSATQAGVQVSQGQATTASFALTPLPSATVSGTVSDGSGHGWPLYAKITIDGYPNGPIYTDPFTGRYSVLLAGPATYTVHVTAAYPPVLQPPGAGYQQQDFQLDVGTSDMTHNIALPIDASACTAAGYGWAGLTQAFTTWTGATPEDGWTVTGSSQGWRFDNPGDRMPPGTPPPLGDNHFAVVDSGFYGSGGRQDAALVSPVIDLSAQSAPHLSFDTGYYAADVRRPQSASVDLSLDGGRTWATVWQHATGDAVGHVDIAIPQAAGDSKARVRFRYTGGDGWYWAVDNVFTGARTCVPLPGGLVAGVVTDGSTGQPADAATVTSNDKPADLGISSGTADPALPGGFYWLFSSLTGSHTFTAAAPGYTTATAAVSVAADQVTRQDWALTPAGGG